MFVLHVAVQIAIVVRSVVAHRARVQALAHVRGPVLLQIFRQLELLAAYLTLYISLRVHLVLVSGQSAMVRIDLMANRTGYLQIFATVRNSGV